jgi:hypothetical protein
VIENFTINSCFANKKINAIMHLFYFYAKRGVKKHCRSLKHHCSQDY